MAEIITGKPIHTGKPIQFTFDLFGFDTNEYAIEKDDGARGKRRYLRGVASGISVDGHGERMTEKAIKSMHDQANRGDILLYADRHGVAYTDDIGKLVKSEVLPNGDWSVEFRLYDQGDGIGANTIERADKLWRQMNGLPPYGKKHQRGFSIEGFIPEQGILQMSQDGRRVVDDVILDGCVVVPRPAYKTSIASAIYKALDEKAPWAIRKEIGGILAQTIEQGDMSSFFRQRYRLQEALESMVEAIMAGEAGNKKEKLTEVFDEYKVMMIDLITKNPEAYNLDTESQSNSDEEVVRVYRKSSSKVDVLKALHDNLCRMEKTLTKELQ